MRVARHSVVAGLLAFSVAACGTSEQQPDPSALSAAEVSLNDVRRADPDAGRLLPGGRAAFRRRIAAARGTPVVVNQWASWCGPCRFEFPFFQRLATRYRGKVAFIGVNARDSSEAARRFLVRYPTPYAHIEDPKADVSRLFRGGRAWPTTAFYDAAGKLRFTHQGAYATQVELEDAVRRWALG